MRFKSGSPHAWVGRGSTQMCSDQWLFAWHSNILIAALTSTVATARCGSEFDILCAVSSSRCGLEEIVQIKQSEMDSKIAVDAWRRKRKRPREKHSRVTPKAAKGLRPPKHSHVTARALKHGLQDTPTAVDSSSSCGSRVWIAAAVNSKVVAVNSKH